MLQELRIRNFAIIEQLSLNFQPGLTVFTGETGAGKSIILDALGAVLGSKMDAMVIRKGETQAWVEAVFSLSEAVKSQLLPLLDREGLLEDPNELTLSREIRAEGRSVARINGRSVSLSLLNEVGTCLVDLHGQSEHLSLLKVKNHLALLDRFASQNETLQAWHSAYAQFQNLQKEYKNLRTLEKTAADRTDMLRYQIQELEGARMVEGEEEDLRVERTRLANAEALSNLCQQALALLDEGNEQSPVVTDLLGQAEDCLNDLARIDDQMLSLAERTAEALSNLSDISYELRNYLEGIEFKPLRLNQIEDRLSLLHQIKRKYGGSISSALEYLHNAKRDIVEVENIDEQLTELDKKIMMVKDTMATLAAELHRGRLAASQRLEEGISERLDQLQMKKARFRVSLQTSEAVDGLLMEGRRLAFNSGGIDEVEFMVETNPGEGFKPMTKIASGGETSRLMLALKSMLGDADQVPVLIFDEIDSGVGGRVGYVVGSMLRKLSADHQVMCVTHLPQLAAFGQTHYFVSKQEENGRTISNVHGLSREERVQELASMLGAEGPTGLQSAREMLTSAEQIAGTIEVN